VRRFLLGLALLPLLAACGGGGGKSSPTTSTTTPKVADPGKAAMIELFRAATHDDKKALWNLLSKPSQQRLGGYDAFASAGAAVIEKALDPFDRGPVIPFVSQSLSQEFGVVAIRSGTKAIAFPLRHEGNAWKIETPGPLTFSIISPTPGSTGSVEQIAVEVDSPGVVDDAVTWVDGKLVRPTLAPSQGKATVFANLTRALPPGGHIAVVFAEEGNDASAEAWSFNVTG
jgi:hypothetical protein